jgi:hypothetical protein
MPVRFHLVEGRHTVCGQFVGEPDSNPVRGILLPIGDAQTTYQADGCMRCHDRDNGRVKPTLVRSRGEY